MHLNVAVSTTTMNFNCYVVLVFLSFGLHRLETCIWWWIVGWLGCLWWLVGCCCSRSNLSIKCRDSCSQSPNSVVLLLYCVRGGGEKSLRDGDWRGKVKEIQLLLLLLREHHQLWLYQTQRPVACFFFFFCSPCNSIYLRTGWNAKETIPRASSLADLIINLWFRQSQPDAGAQ